MNLEVFIKLVKKADKDNELAFVPAEPLMILVESIIDECATIGDDFHNLYSPTNFTDAGDAIRAHFGVK